MLIKRGVIISTILILTLMFTLLSIPSVHAANGTVSAYGQLKVVGTQLCNSSGSAVQLKGMSSHGLQWFGQFMSSGAIQTTKDSWGANVVRAAMYVEDGGYKTDSSTYTQKVKDIVNIAKNLDMYVIVDWHILSDGNPLTNMSYAQTFFTDMASTYANVPNVIYEICNEPNGDGGTWSNIKSYANTIIPIIRSKSSNAVVLVGTPNWSQDVDTASSDKLSFSNVMYSVHFYAGTHTQYLRDKVSTAMNNGAAIFCTEWGTSDASGNGGPYTSEADNWMNFFDSKKISWCNWSLCDKSETSAALASGASSSGGWSDSNLTTSGKYVKSKMGGGSTSTSAPTATPTTSGSSTTIPGKIEAENYSGMSGIQTESCGEGTKNVGWVDTGDWMDYNVNVQTAGNYQVDFRVAAQYGSSNGIQLMSGGNALCTVSVPNTGAWQTYTTVSANVYLNAGQQTLRIYANNSMWNLNWFEFVSSTTTQAPTQTQTPTQASTSNGSGNCTLTYTISSDWGSGATINMGIKNNGSSTVNGWTLVFSFSGNQQITSSWNGTFTQSSKTVTVSSSTSIPAGGSVSSIGFNISYSGSNAKPTSATLNSSSCTVQ